MKKAFSLLELIIVILILGVIASLAIPKLSSNKTSADLAKSLSDLKTLVNDLSIYALTHNTLSTFKNMTNVTLDDADLSHISNSFEAFYKVGNDPKCVSLLFVNQNKELALIVSTNSNVKNALLNKLDTSNLDFTSNSTDKTCVLLSKDLKFKNLAKKYVLLGE